MPAAGWETKRSRSRVYLFQEVNPKPGSAPRVDTAVTNNLFARGPVPADRSAPPTRDMMQGPPLTAAFAEFAPRAQLQEAAEEEGYSTAYGTPQTVGRGGSAASSARR